MSILVPVEAFKDFHLVTELRDHCLEICLVNAEDGLSKFDLCYIWLLDCNDRSLLAMEDSRYLMRQHFDYNPRQNPFELLLLHFFLPFSLCFLFIFAFLVLDFV